MLSTYIAFEGPHRIALGTLAEAAIAAKRAHALQTNQAVLVFDAASGEQIELNLQGSEEDVLTGLQTSVSSEAPVEDDEAESVSRKTPGRPRLGVIPREVTLLPRHWDWLASQPGGASVALRKLVEHGMRSVRKQDHARQLRDAAYRFMHAIAGNEAGFEEAARALFGNNPEVFRHTIAPWPNDIREHLTQLSDKFFDAHVSSSA